MSGIRTIGLVGGGVIGAAWAARAVLFGHDAVLCDPDPEAERKTAEVLANARRAYAKLLPGRLPVPGTLRLVPTIEEAAEAADFIQESLPEREDLKIALLARADRAARPEVVIASSTSGLLPTRLQSGMAHPERLVVGHPFNPVYLMPLVELCAGAATAPETVARAGDFYRAIGMRPLHVRKEIDGFIADRLMEALWREALWLIHDDVATAEEIDDAIRFGPGLRWAFMGTFLIYRIAGGEPGMRHFMAQFGPSLKWPWTKLMDVPELDEALLEKIVAQSDAQAGTATIRALERLRDDCIVTITQGLARHDLAAGAVLNALQASTATGGEPLRLLQTAVEPGWIDYNGHMTEARYLEVFSRATDRVMAHIGADAAYVAGGLSYFTAETHLLHRAEAKLGDALAVSSQVLAADAKRLHLFHRLHRAADDAVLATAEHMLLHVALTDGKVCPARPDIADRLAALAQAHAGLPRPAEAGRAVGMR